MAREDPQFRIRLPADLKARVEQSAKDNGRSLNAEIVQRLEESISLDRTQTGLYKSVLESERKMTLIVRWINAVADKTGVSVPKLEDK